MYTSYTPRRGNLNLDLRMVASQFVFFVRTHDERFFSVAPTIVSLKRHRYQEGLAYPPGSAHDTLGCRAATWACFAYLAHHPQRALHESVKLVHGGRLPPQRDRELVHPVLWDLLRELLLGQARLSQKLALLHEVCVPHLLDVVHGEGYDARIHKFGGGETTLRLTTHCVRW